MFGMVSMKNKINQSIGIRLWIFYFRVGDYDVSYCLFLSTPSSKQRSIEYIMVSEIFITRRGDGNSLGTLVSQQFTSNTIYIIPYCKDNKIYVITYDAETGAFIIQYIPK